MVDAISEAKCAAQALGHCRPTVADAEILRSALGGLDSGADGEQAPSGRPPLALGSASSQDSARKAPSVEKLGQWVPLLDVALGKDSGSCWRGTSKGLRPLRAHTPLDIRRLAVTLHAARAGSGSTGEPDEVDAVNSWEPLGQLAATHAPAPLHEVLARLGAATAAEQARAQVRSTFSEAVESGKFVTLDSGAKSRAITMQDLAALEWAGMECQNVDDKARTPLHMLCAIEGQKLIGDTVLGGTPATLARRLCARWPAALLVEDAEGLTPLNYLTPPLCTDIGYIGGSHRELLTAVAESFEHCIRQCPVALISTLRCSEPLRTALIGAFELGDESRHASLVLPSLMRLADGGAWECALIAWRNDTCEARDRCREAGDIQALIRTCRILAGADSAIPDQATLFQKFQVDQSALDASNDCDISAEPVLGSLLQRVEDVQAEWHERQLQLEDRIADLEAELGRMPIAPASSAQGVAAIPELGHPLITPDSAGQPLEDAEVANITESTPQSFAEHEAEEFVTRVRRLRLVDANLDNTSALVREGADRVRQVLVRAVERIAEDLYELESHFIYELVQNADDNSYPETFGESELQCPTLRLLLRFDEGDDSVGRRPSTFFFSANNELGLRGEDVMALCDVNASSKKGKKGYTGQKGIGWKSTFQVSDCPYMLSGNFSFKFDISGPLGRLGYVTPTWVGAKEMAALPREVLEAHGAGATVVYLPLRPGAAESVALALKHLEEHHSCLLFMRRLRRLEMVYSDGCSATYERTGEDSNSKVLVTKSFGEQEVSMETLHYLVYSHGVELPSGDQSYLSLAFPMAAEAAAAEGADEGGIKTDSATEGGRSQAAGSTEPPLQALYCGPPVRRVGFRFAINGPFDLVANRGDIHEGSAANHVLCEAIPAAFAEALRLHKESIGPRTLAFIGQESVDGLWRRVRTRLLACLEGAACVPTEDGGLAVPKDCVLRPSGALAAAASWLIPAKLLLEACGQRFAKASQASGALRGLGLQELGLEHWKKILAYRGGDWPKGLLGAAAEAADPGFFRPLLTWLEDAVHLAEHPSETLQKLWTIELWPSAEPAGKLMALSDGPIMNSFCKDLPENWQRKLCSAGALRVLDPQVRSGLEGGAARFASAVTVAQPSCALVAGICLEWHLLRFSTEQLEELRPPKEEAIWASLACIMEAFHAGVDPHACDAAGAVSSVASTEIGKRLSDWSEVGSVLFLPTHGGMPPLARCAELVCPTYLGVPGLSSEAAAAALNNSLVPSSAALGVAGLAPPHRFISPRYLDGNWGDPLRWEVFWHTLGVRPLSPAGRGIPKSVSTAVSASLGTCLADAAWWSKALATITLSKYVCSRILEACESEVSWLRGLPVVGSGGGLGGSPPLACVSGLFLYDSYGSLGSKYLPYARLPSANISEKVIDVQQARECLTMLGVTTMVTVQGLVQCLQILKAGGCRDSEIFAELYKHIAQIGVAHGSQAINVEERQSLSRLVLVPARGFVTAAACTWEDMGVMQWLAEVPALEAFYGRYGSSLRHFFVEVAGVTKEVASFHPKIWLHALKRIVELVDEANSAPSELSGAPLSAEALLNEIGSLAGEVYGHLAAACCHLLEEEALAVAHVVETERLVLISSGDNTQKRLPPSQAWWDVAEDLSEVRSLTRWSLKNHYGDLGLEDFFVNTVGVRHQLTRETLKEQLGQETGYWQLTRWGGLSRDDLEDLVTLQTSSDFRPPDWEPPAEEAMDSDSDDGGPPRPPGEPPPQPHPNPDGGFRPRRGGGRHVPPWRSREEAEEDAEEEERRRSRRNEPEQTPQDADPPRRSFLVQQSRSGDLDNASEAASEPPAQQPPVELDRRRAPRLPPPPAAAGAAGSAAAREAVAERAAGASAAARSEESRTAGAAKAAARAANSKAAPKAPARPEAPAPPLTAEDAQRILREVEAAREEDQEDNHSDADAITTDIPAEHIQIIFERIEAYEKEEEDKRTESVRLREHLVQTEDEIDRYSKILQQVYPLDSMEMDSAPLAQQAAQRERLLGRNNAAGRRAASSAESTSLESTPQVPQTSQARVALARAASVVESPLAPSISSPLRAAVEQAESQVVQVSKVPADAAATATASRRRRGFTSALERQPEATVPTFSIGAALAAAATAVDNATNEPTLDADGSRAELEVERPTRLATAAAATVVLAAAPEAASPALSAARPAASNAQSAATTGAAASRRRGFTAALVRGSASTPDASSGNLTHGDRVTIHSLRSRPELNGRIGTITTFSEAQGRYVVYMERDDEKMFLKPENLFPCM